MVVVVALPGDSRFVFVHEADYAGKSDNGGLTWHSQRPATWLLEEMHGGVVQLPDERVVFIYIHRGPTHRGGERVKVSSDESNIWHEELYFLTASPSYPVYSGSCVLSPHIADGDRV